MRALAAALFRRVFLFVIINNSLTLLYLSQEQPGLGRTKRLASQHRQLPPKEGHNQRRRITVRCVCARVPRLAPNPRRRRARSRSTFTGAHLTIMADVEELAIHLLTHNKTNQVPRRCVTHLGLKCR